MGFAPDRLQKVVREQGLRLRRFIYNEARQRRQVRREMDNTLRNFRREVAATGEATVAIDLYASDFANRVVSMAPTLKHPSFVEEDEWRLISGPIPHKHPQLKFRAGKSMLPPYFELNLADTSEAVPVARLVIGPTPHFDLAHAAVGALLLKEISRYDITHSKIPYRDW